MPSPGEDIQSWSTVAGDNGSADPLIVWTEGQARASVNNSARGMMAAHAKNRNLLNGSIVTTGTPDAQQFLSGVTYTTIPTGLVVKLKVGSGLTNTASMTLNMDGLGDTLVKTATGDDLLGGEFVANGYVDLLYNGTNWIFLYSREFMFDRITSGGGIIIGQQKFTTAGSFTYTPTDGMECCIIECVGGGGGGGGAYAGVSEFWQGGGGGAGGYSRKLATAADIGASQTVTVGSGGQLTFFTASAGTATSVGSLCLANGGGPGGGGQNGVLNPIGGTGGSTSGAIGDIVAAGAPGQPGGIVVGTTGQVVPLGGMGGSSFFGGGGTPGFISSTGTTGGNYGGGGSGGSSYNLDGGKIGGAGSPGIVVITEFAGRGAPGRDGPQGPIGPAGPSGVGTGDVLRSGTPTTGQIAEWTDASHIRGVSALASSKVQGTATNDSAAAGYVGQYLSNSVSAGVLSAGAATTMTNITLTAGDWDVRAGLALAGSTTGTNRALACLSTSAATLNLAPGQCAGSPVLGFGVAYLQVGPHRFSVASNTTIYLVAYCDAAATNVDGIISARRVR